MQEINLLQSKVRDTTYSWEKQSNLVLWILSIILILLVGAAAGLYFLTQNLDQKNNDSIAENARLQTTLAQKGSNLSAAKIFQAQLSNVKALLVTHVYYSSFLDEIEKVTYKKAQYVTLDADQATGHVHVEGRVDSYTELGKLLLGLSTSPKFSEVKLLSATPSSGEVNGFNFSVDLIVDHSTFKANNTK